MTVKIRIALHGFTLLYIYTGVFNTVVSYDTVEFFTENYLQNLQKVTFI